MQNAQISYKNSSEKANFFCTYKKIFPYLLFLLILEKLIQRNHTIFQSEVS